MPNHANIASKQRQLRIIDTLIISIILIVFLAELDPYIQQYMFPPTGDPANHLLNILAVREHLCSSIPFADKLAPVLLWMDAHAYPPIGYIFTGAASAVFDTLSIASIASLQAFWIIITGLATYSLCRTLFDTKDQPKLGSIIALCVLPAVIFQPAFTAHIITFHIDLPSAATVMLFLAASARAMEMKSLPLATVSGTALGIALLVKWTSAIYMAPAVLFLIRNSLYKCRLRQIVRFVLAVMLPFILLLSVWIYIKANHIPTISHETGWPFTRIAWIIFGLDIAIGIICFVLLMLIQERKTRNLAMVLIAAIIIAAPFYLFNFDQLRGRAEHHASDDLGTHYYVKNPHESFFYHNFVSPTNAFVWAFILPGSIWLLWKGPKGSFMLIAAPLIFATIINSYVLGLRSCRFYLTGFPLQIITAAAWLMSYKWPKYPAITAVLFLGLGFMLEWAALAPPRGEYEGLSLSDLGTGPASFIASLEQIAGKTNKIIANKTSSLWFVDGTKKTTYITLQAAAFVSGNDLCVRSWRSDREAYKSLPITRITKYELFHSPGQGQGTVGHAGRRILLAHNPEWERHDLENICEADLRSQTNAWILIIGNPSLKEIKQYLSKPITVGHLGEQPARLYKCDINMINEGAEHENNR